MFCEKVEYIYVYIYHYMQDHFENDVCSNRNLMLLILQWVKNVFFHTTYMDYYGHTIRTTIGMNGLSDK